MLPDWIDLSFQEPRPGMILNLRRTNLVKMAISKAQHGFHVETRTVVPGIDRILLDFDMMLHIIRLFPLADQEYASYVAFNSAPKADVALLLYEDLFRQTDTVLKSLRGWFNEDLGTASQSLSGVAVHTAAG